MELFKRSAGKKTRGQTMVEFALVLPILLLTMYGIMEFGRLLFIFVTTTSAAREATRYASAIEVAEGSTVERFRDCDGIRAAARQVDVLNAIQSINVTYYRDYGVASSEVNKGTCPEGGVGPTTLKLGDQVVVEVIGNFQTIVPIVPINIDEVRSESTRTIVKDVPVGVLVPPIEPVNPPVVPAPFTSFVGNYYFVAENDTSYHDPNYFSIMVQVKNEDGTIHTDPVTVNYSISGEAANGSDYILRSTNPITLNNGFGEINIEIIDDSQYEYYERVIITLGPVAPGGVVWPSTYVLYIIDDDRIPPFVEFVTPTSLVLENGSPNHSIDLQLLNESGLPTTSQRDTYVPVTVISGNATLGFDFNPQTNVVRIPAGAYGAPFVVDIFDDSIREGDKNVVFQIGTPLNGRTDPEGQLTHELTIRDNEPEGYVLNCNYYGISSWSVSQEKITVRLFNNDPLLAPVYITGITLGWSSNQTSYLQSIRFPTIFIWSGNELSEFQYSWDNLSFDRQLRQATKDLVFYTTRNNPTRDRVVISLDNGCPPVSLP